MTTSHDAGREAVARAILDGWYEGNEEWDRPRNDMLKTRAYWAADGVLALIEAASQPREGDGLAGRIAEVMDEDGGCWSPCSGCQEGVDGYVSEKDYPYSTTFKCQPGGGCRECGGIGVLWQDGAFLASYGEALTQRPPEQAGAVRGRIAKLLVDEVKAYRHAQDAATSERDKLYRMGQKDALILIARQIDDLLSAAPTPPDAGIGSDGAGERV
jgi:hypothetical protein